MRRLALPTTLVLLGCSASHGSVSDASPPDAPPADARSMDAGPLPACPTDPFAAEGTACPVAGQTCGDCPGDPCSYCNELWCQAGVWTRIEAFPAPCHDCGDAGPCVSISQYCDISRSDVGGEPDLYRCPDLPAACLGDLSCTCLRMSVAFDACSGDGTAGLTVEHFGG